MEIARLIFGLLAGSAGAAGAGLHLVYLVESPPEFWTWMILPSVSAVPPSTVCKAIPGLSAISSTALAAPSTPSRPHFMPKRFPPYQEGVDDKMRKLARWW